MANIDTNSGNYLHTNYGYCKQVIYQVDSPRPVSQRWLDRTGCLLGASVMFLMLALAGCYLVEQWWPLLNNPVPAGGLATHARASLPVFWTLLSCALVYGHCATRIFKHE